MCSQSVKVKAVTPLSSMLLLKNYTKQNSHLTLTTLQHVLSGYETMCTLTCMCVLCTPGRDSLTNEVYTSIQSLSCGMRIWKTRKSLQRRTNWLPAGMAGGFSTLLTMLWSTWNTHRQIFYCSNKNAELMLCSSEKLTHYKTTATCIILLCNLYFHVKCSGKNVIIGSRKYQGFFS